jgi:Uma2 family endonuclease
MTTTIPVPPTSTAPTIQARAYDEHRHPSLPFPINGHAPPPQHGDHFFALSWEEIERLEETLVTEDDEPVDNPFCERQQGLLTGALHDSWDGPGDGRPFVAMAYVGLFEAIGKSPIVPDMFLSVDVSLPDDLWKKGHRAYTYWRYGKPPDVVVEIVSNKEGNEFSDKLLTYALQKVVYYVVFDPTYQMSQETLQVFKLHGGSYQQHQKQGDVWWMPEVNLGLRLWEGTYRHTETMWLRWCSKDGEVVPTGDETAQRERSEKERERSEKERERSEKERALVQAQRERSEKERERSEKERALVQVHQERSEKERERSEKERERSEKERALVQAHQERSEKERALQQMERFASQLRALGIDPEL